MTTIVELLVEVKAAKNSTGPHETDAVEFRYYGLNQTGKQLLENPGGDLDLRGISPDVSLRFVLANKTLEWAGDIWDVTFPANATDALWIFENQLAKETYQQVDPEFHGVKHAQYSGRPTVAVEGHNKRSFIYDYALTVEVHRAGRRYTHRHDPQIKNGGLRFNPYQMLQYVLLPALLLLVTMLLVVDLIVRFTQQVPG